MPETLAQRVRKKYPGVYDDLTDDALDAKVRAKYPGVYDDVPRSTSAPPEVAPDEGYQHPLAAFGAGVMKGAGNTIAGLGQMTRRLGSAVTGGMIDPETQAFETVRAEMQPRPGAERAGFATEQIGEFFVAPEAQGAKAVRLAARGLTSAGLARAQGASTSGAVTTGALATVPVGGAVGAAGEWIGSKAEPLVRAAIKPTVAAMRKIAGSSVTGLDAQAGKLARFIIDNRVTTADKAQKIVTEAEAELQKVLSAKNAPTDAAERALRYLGALEKSAAKQGLPAADVKILRSAATEMLESGLGEDVIRLVPGRGKGAIGGLKPVVVGRAPRTDVTATEAMERARASSRWTTRKQWGEQKGAEMEAAKAVERGLRDAVKAGVPEAKPILKRMGEALRAKEALDRAAFRAANRDAVSLPAHVIAAGEISAGKLPIVATAANWLRNNQLKAGIWADSLAKAIKRNDAPAVAEILQRLGVGAVATSAAAP